MITAPFAAPNGIPAVKALFGDYKFVEQSGGNVMADSGWTHDNLVVEHNVAGTGINIQLHKKIAPFFEECMKEAVRRCPTYKVRMLGGFCARHMQHNPNMPLSIHSWGAAFDVNWDKNPMAPVLVTDLPDDFIKAFTENGWEWGGSWKSTKDAMHFQYATGC